MVVLVVISIIEVTVYSYLINPGQDVSVYDAHAQVSAPWVSGIFGFVIFFFVVRHWSMRKSEGVLRLTILFTLAYVTLDVIILFVYGVNWADFYATFIFANGVKFLGGLTAHYFYHRKI